MMHGVYSAQRVAKDTSFMAVRRAEGDMLIVFMVYCVAIVKGTLWRFFLTTSGAVE